MRCAGEGMRSVTIRRRRGEAGVRFIRHATFVFEAGRVRVLVDPILEPDGGETLSVP